MGFFGGKSDKAPIVTYLDDYSQEKSEKKAAECSSVIPIPPETAVTESEVVEIVDDLPGKGDDKITKNPTMKPVAPLNTLADKAVASAGALYRTVEIVHKGAIPLDLVVSTMVTAVQDFNALKTELHTFQRDGVWMLDDVMTKFADISEECAIITDMVKNQQEMEAIMSQLDGLLVMTKLFLELVSTRCRELQHLRKRTAHAWLAATGVASFTVGGAAAAMCVLSGGVALPVLAPLLAFGAGTTAVATASHIAFSSSLGAQIKDLDQKTKQLGTVQQDVKMIERKAESKKNAGEENMIEGKPRKKFWW